MYLEASPIDTALLLERARLGFRLHGELDLCRVTLPDLCALAVWVLMRVSTFLGSFQGGLQDVLWDVCTGLPVPQPAACSLAEWPAQTWHQVLDQQLHSAGPFCCAGMQP